MIQKQYYWSFYALSNDTNHETMMQRKTLNYLPSFLGVFRTTVWRHSDFSAWHSGQIYFLYVPWIIVPTLQHLHTQTLENIRLCYWLPTPYTHTEREREREGGEKIKWSRFIVFHWVSDHHIIDSGGSLTHFVCWVISMMASHQVVIIITHFGIFCRHLGKLSYSGWYIDR